MINPKEHMVYFDGPSLHFKNYRAMYFVGRYPHLLRDCQMKWDFFGIGHNKGESFISILHS